MKDEMYDNRTFLKRTHHFPATFPVYAGNCTYIIIYVHV